MQTIQVKVKPNARASTFARSEAGTWLAHLKSPPVEGKSNEELIALVARQFGCRKAEVTIVGGALGRMKWVRIACDD